jgi:phosphatidylglycerophosphate synthase
MDRKRIEYSGYKTSFGTIYTNIPYRVFAYWFAIRIYKLPITPNQLSIFAMIMSFIGSCFYIFDDYVLNLIGVLFFNLFCVFACSDGLVARLQGKSSILGAYVNHVTEKFSYFAIMVSLCINASIHYNELFLNINLYLIGIFFMFSRMLTYDLELKIFELAEKIPKYSSDSYAIINSKFKPNFFYRAFTFNNTNLLFLITFGTIIDQIYYTFVLISIYSVLFCLAVVFRFGITFKNH